MEGVKWNGTFETFFRLILRWGHVLLSGFVIYNFFYPMSPLGERAIFLFGVFFLAVFQQIGRLKTQLGKKMYAIFPLLSLLVFGYVIVNFVDIEARSGLVTSLDIVLGILAILLILEATRSIVSTPLVILALFFLAYALFGAHLPRTLGGHPGFDLERWTTYVYLSLNGVFGIVTYVLFKYVFLFVMFGKLLEASGAIDYIMDLCNRLVGRFTGGPAMVSVISSACMGTLSGSAVANVMVTGSITIPIMKKSGFEPHMAGAVEAAASTGGQFMPPVMGASAFLIMQFLGISYLEVCKAALIPAALYFLGVLASVYFYSSRSRLGGLSSSDGLPGLRSIMFRREGLVFGVAVFGLIFFLVTGYSPTRAALYSISLGILFSWAKPKKGVGFKKIVSIMEETSKSFQLIGVAGGSVGLIMAVLLMTGLATRFSTLVIEFSGGNLLVVLFLTLLVSIALGMGLPTAVAYIVLAMTSVPALTELGVVPIAAHLFIFYTGMLAMVTPPVALAAFAGATIAGANFWRTGVWASILALPAHLIAFAFVYNPALLTQGSPFSIFTVTVSAALGVCFLSFSLMGRVKARKEIVGRFLVFLGAPLLIHPYFNTDLLGLAFALIGFAIYYSISPSMLMKKFSFQRDDSH